LKGSLLLVSWQYLETYIRIEHKLILQDIVSGEMQIVASEEKYVDGDFRPSRDQIVVAKGSGEYELQGEHSI
jgi:hypothetical protein